MIPSGLLERITRESGVPQLLDVLGRALAARDLHSLLLAVFAARAAARAPLQVLGHYTSSRFVAPSAVDPRTMAAIDRVAWDLLPESYVGVELSPVCPLGTASTVADISQHNVVSAVGNTEVVSDSTNVLALECAARRRRARKSPALLAQPVLLAASHRLIRGGGQPCAGPGAWWTHFRVFCLCAAGRRQGPLGFESPVIVQQVLFYLRVLQALAAQGWMIGSLRVAVTDLSDGALAARIQSQILDPLCAQRTGVACHLDATRSAGRHYYDGVCFAIFGGDGEGREVQYVDGGTTAWASRLLNDRNERLVISGLATERICVQEFRLTQ